MPVYPLRFSRYEGRRISTRRSWWLIARTSLKGLQWNRPLRILRVLWVVYTVFFLGLIYLAERGTIFGLPIGEELSGEALPFLTHTPTRLFAYLVSPLMFLWLVILALFSSASLMAEDRRTGAIGLYLSKPVTRFQYLAGRISVPAILFGLFAILPAFGLLVFEILIAEDTLPALADLALVPSLLGVGVALVVLLGLPVLVLSSVLERGRIAGVVFVAYWLLSDFIGGLVDLILGFGMGTFLDLDRMLMGVAIPLFRPKGGEFIQGMGGVAAPWACFLAVGVYGVLFLGILWYRSRAGGANR